MLVLTFSFSSFFTNVHRVLFVLRFSSHRRILSCNSHPTPYRRSESHLLCTSSLLSSNITQISRKRVKLLTISFANVKLSANTRVYISTIIINLSQTTNQTRIPSMETSFFPTSRDSHTRRITQTKGPVFFFFRSFPPPILRYPTELNHLDRS